MAALLKIAHGAVKKSVDTVHSARVSVTHKLRGVREDGLLGKTELEARMYAACRDERFGEAALLKTRLDEILLATRAQARASAAKDFAAAERWNHELNALRVREPFETALAAKAAERHARGDIKQRKPRLARRVTARVADSARSARVRATFRVRGRRKDGGLGRTELEALAIEADVRCQDAQAALLRLRAEAIGTARQRQREAHASGDAAGIARWDAELVRLRARDKFMTELLTLHRAPSPASDETGGSADGTDQHDVVGTGDLATADGLFLRSLVYEPEPEPEPQTAIEGDSSVPDAASLPAPLDSVQLAVTPQTPVLASVAAAVTALAGTGRATPETRVSDPCSSYESFLPFDSELSRVHAAAASASSSDGRATFGGKSTAPAHMAPGSGAVTVGARRGGL